MNHHSAPPGGWQPPEPPWMAEAREIVASVNRLSECIHGDVQRFVRQRRLDTLLWFVGGMGGYWAGFLSVELLKWWVGLK